MNCSFGDADSGILCSTGTKRRPSFIKKSSHPSSQLYANEVSKLCCPNYVILIAQYRWKWGYDCVVPIGQDRSQSIGRKRKQGFSSMGDSDSMNKRGTVWKHQSEALPSIQSTQGAPVSKWPLDSYS